MVEQSATPNIAQLVGTQDGKTLVPVYNWSSFFARCKKIRRIKDLHQFQFFKDNAGNKLSGLVLTVEVC